MSDDQVKSCVPVAHHFDIMRSGTLWRVKDRAGLIGGLFRTRKAAFRFAMSEADGNRTCVHLRRVRKHP